MRGCVRVERVWGERESSREGRRGCDFQDFRERERENAAMKDLVLTFNGYFVYFFTTILYSTHGNDVREREK